MASVTLSSDRQLSSLRKVSGRRGVLPLSITSALSIISRSRKHPERSAVLSRRGAKLTHRPPLGEDADSWLKRTSPSPIGPLRGRGLTGQLRPAARASVQSAYLVVY